MLSRSTMRILGAASLVALVGGGCSPAAMDPGTLPVNQDLKVCTTRGCGTNDEPNGRGIHIARTNPLSQYGIHNSDGTLHFWMTHFESSAGKVQAAGYFLSSTGTATKALSDVISASYDGKPAALHNITTEGSVLLVTLRDSSSNLFTLKGEEVLGLELNFALASLDRRVGRDIRLTFDATDEVPSPSGDVFSYTVRYADRTLGDAPTELCQNKLTGPESNLFFGSASWHPITSVRTDAKEHTTITCRSGATAVCMAWGYRPWASAINGLTDVEESLRDTHMACMNMKRAAYCGGAETFTLEGTKILIQDVYKPSFNGDMSPLLEAAWTPKGATCVSNPRHDPATYFASACSQTLPQCPTNGAEPLVTSLP